MPSYTYYVHGELHADINTDVHPASLTAASNAADVSNIARVTGPTGKGCICKHAQSRLCATCPYRLHTNTALAALLITGEYLS